MDFITFLENIPDDVLACFSGIACGIAIVNLIFLVLFWHEDRKDASNPRNKPRKHSTKADDNRDE